VSSVVGLGPEAVQDEGEVLSALGPAGVGGAELRRPGEVEKVEVEGAVAGRCGETAAVFTISANRVRSR